MKKKLQALLLAGVLVLSVLLTPVLAEEVETIEEINPSVEIEQPEATEQPEEVEPIEPIVYDDQTLVVSTTTAFNGNFFDKMFGNNTSDLDVRDLLHGYNLVRWAQTLGGYEEDPSVVSGLAVLGGKNDGSRKYVITLYDDLYYSDGTKIGAKDYAFALLLSVSKEAEAIGGSIATADWIEGVKAYKNGETDTISGFRLVSDNIFSITITEEYLPFFYELGLLSLNPYPISVIAPGCEIADDGNGIYIRNIDETIEEPIFTAELLEETILNPETGYLTYPSVVSGPYVLTGYDGVAATFQKNDYYKGNGDGEQVLIPNLIYTLSTNEEMITQLKEGKLGLVHKATEQSSIMEGMALISGTNQFQMTNYARMGNSFFAFACERLALSEKEVRQAIAYSLDKEELVKAYVGNFGLRVDGYYGVGQWMYGLLTGSKPYPIEEMVEGATEEDQVNYDETLAKWEALTMEDIPVYDLNPEAAVSLLEYAGWNLNETGAAFDPKTDEVRCKAFDKENLIAEEKYEAAMMQGGIEITVDDKEIVLLPLRLKLIYPEGNVMAESFEEFFFKPLAEVGILVEAAPVEMTELLKIYYRQNERDVDMIYLATNYAKIFEPSETFNPKDAFQGVDNRTAIVDEKLYELAVEMRKNEPGDTLGYCTDWLEFQKEYQDAVPAINVYSNVYFDFYTKWLHDYNVTEEVTWTQAIVGAYLSEPEESEEEVVDEEDIEVEGEVTIIG